MPHSAAKLKAHAQRSSCIIKPCCFPPSVSERPFYFSKHRNCVSSVSQLFKVWDCERGRAGQPGGEILRMIFYCAGCGNERLVLGGFAFIIEGHPQLCHMREKLFYLWDSIRITGVSLVAYRQDFAFTIKDHFREIIRHEFDGAGIAIVEMLFRSSIFALVGVGRTPKYPSNKVIIWNDDQNRSRCISELSFRSKVRAVRLRRDKIVVVLEFKIYVYNFADLKLLHEIETLANTKAICALSSKATSCVLACPGQHEGEIRIELFIDSLKKSRLLLAHNSSLACLALSHDGAFLATASSKGTLIRVFSTMDGSKLQEVRRGADQAEIYSIAFSENAHWGCSF